MSFKKVSHVIFDLDGLIIDSETIYDNVMEKIAARFGKEFTKEMSLKIMGTPDNITAEIAISEMQLPLTTDQFLDIYVPETEKYLQHPKLMPGAKRLIEHLYSNKIPIAIATGSPKELFKIKMKDHQDLVPLFHHVVFGSSDPELKNGKPAPDIFLLCANRFSDKPQPEQCLVFEDSPNGTKAGVAAGMQVVMVPAPHVKEESKRQATLVLNSLEEFRPELFGLPAFQL